MNALCTVDVFKSVQQQACGIATVCARLKENIMAILRLQLELSTCL